MLSDNDTFHPEMCEPAKPAVWVRCYFDVNGLCVGYSGYGLFGRRTKRFIPDTRSSIVGSVELKLPVGYSPIGKTCGDLEFVVKDCLTSTRQLLENQG